MARLLTHRELIAKLSRKTGLSERTLKRVYEALLKILLEELDTAGEVRLRNIGRIYKKDFGGYDMQTGNLYGGSSERRYVERRSLPKMEFSDNFKDAVAGKIVSREGKKRLRKGELTQRDKDLIKRKAKKSKSTLESLIETKANTGKSIQEIVKARKDD